MASTDRPTAKQLALLRQLAAGRGQTFAYPATRRQASREIERLLDEPRAPRSDRAGEPDSSEEFGLDAARVRTDEIQGFGATAAWRRGR